MDERCPLNLMIESQQEGRVEYAGLPASCKKCCSTLMLEMDQSIAQSFPADSVDETIDTVDDDTDEIWVNVQNGQKELRRKKRLEIRTNTDEIDNPDGDESHLYSYTGYETIACIGIQLALFKV